MSTDAPSDARDRATISRETADGSQLVATESSSGAVSAIVSIPTEAHADAIEAVRVDLDAELRQLAAQAGGTDGDE